MSGRLAVVGLGPGAPELITPLASDTLAAATDLVGYAPYLARVPERAGQRRHASDNREELVRAREALDLAAEGKSVAVVSSGDPGVFAKQSDRCGVSGYPPPGHRGVRGKAQFADRPR